MAYKVLLERSPSRSSLRAPQLSRGSPGGPILRAGEQEEPGVVELQRAHLAGFPSEAQ